MRGTSLVARLRGLNPIDPLRGLLGCGMCRVLLRLSPRPTRVGPERGASRRQGERTECGDYRLLRPHHLAALIWHGVQPAVERRLRRVDPLVVRHPVEDGGQASRRRAESHGDSFRVAQRGRQLVQPRDGQLRPVPRGGECGVRVREGVRQIRALHAHTDRGVHEFGADRFSRRDTDGDALPLHHVARGTERDRVLQSASDPNAAVRSDLGHDSVSEFRPIRAGPIRKHGREHADVLEFLAAIPHLLSEVGCRRGVPQHGPDERTAPARFAFPVRKDDQPVRPEDRRRAGDVPEFSCGLAAVLGLPDQRRWHEDRESRAVHVASPDCTVLFARQPV